MLEAEAALHQALAVATTQDEPPMQWHIHLALHRLYPVQERQVEAEHEFAAAQAIIEELAATVEDSTLRNNFRQKAIYCY